MTCPADAVTGLRPYPAYKDSGVSWLGKVPKHWSIVPGRSCYREKKIRNSGMIEKQVLSLSFGRIVVKPEGSLHGLVPASFETYQVIDPDDIIVRPTDMQNDQHSLRFGISRHRGIITSAYLCLVTSDALTREYGYLLLDSYDHKKVFYGLGSGLRQNLDWSDFKYLPCVQPPLPEQAAIVRYLTHIDRQIRQYIRAKQKLIKLLEEQKQVIIQQAVTRGLGPDVRLKSHRMEWLGDVPENWEVLPLKRMVSTRITDGPHETPTFLDEGVDFLSAESMVNGHFIFERRRGYISRKLHESYCQKCRPRRDDIFMCKSGATTGKVAIVETDKEFSVWSPLALIRVDETRALSLFIFAVLQSRYVQGQVRDISSYGTQPNLAMGAMERLIMAVPPLDEQHMILNQLDSRLSGIEAGVALVTRANSLLLEHRSSLIADVLTGKLDVREVVTSLPEEPSVQEFAYEERDLVTDDDVAETENQRDQAEEINE